MQRAKFKMKNENQLSKFSTLHFAFFISLHFTIVSILWTNSDTVNGLPWTLL